MDVMEILKAVILGIVEGITEWLPISSTGHMILVDEFLKMNVTPEFKEMFLVVIQLGAILAVVLLFWNKMWPFTTKQKGWVKKDTFSIWYKVLVACIPAAILELAAGDYIEATFYNYWVVSLALIIFGMAFILIEDRNKRRKPAVNYLSEITYKDAFIIGIFQLIAAIFPGTSRSGATILGAILIGIARPAAAEFTFFLAVPVMFGASLIKVLKFGLAFTSAEAVILLTGMAVAFVVSVIVIRFLMDYILSLIHIYNHAGCLRLRGDCDSFRDLLISFFMDRSFVLVDPAASFFFCGEEKIKRRISKLFLNKSAKHFFAVIYCLTIWLQNAERIVQSNLSAGWEVGKICKFFITDSLDLHILCGIDFQTAGVDSVICLIIGIAFFCLKHVHDLIDQGVDIVRIRIVFFIGNLNVGLLNPLIDVVIQRFLIFCV